MGFFDLPYALSNASEANRSAKQAEGRLRTVGIFGDDDGCMPNDGEINSAVSNGPGPNGENYDPNYKPPFLSGTGCNACGYDDISDGETCACCGIGHGITQ